MPIAMTLPDVGAAVTSGLDGLDTQLLAIIPAGLAVTAVLWGAPKAVSFFKRIAK